MSFSTDATAFCRTEMYFLFLCCWNEKWKNESLHHNFACCDFLFDEFHLVWKCGEWTHVEKFDREFFGWWRLSNCSVCECVSLLTFRNSIAYTQHPFCAAVIVGPLAVNSLRWTLGLPLLPLQTFHFFLGVFTVRPFDLQTKCDEVIY